MIGLIILLIIFVSALSYSPGKGPVFAFFITIILMMIASIRFKSEKLLFNKPILKYSLLMIVVGALVMSSLDWVFFLRTKALYCLDTMARWRE